ncbi:MAG: helix-turn-helix transcriptional regulator [Candidatus Schekmanbacteria bacterium]|nr:helix-turn-helix transcriptional regulator [Candidatus Schekmanbacteria bacterium]
MKAISFGEFFKEQRIKKRITLRQFCIENGLDAGNISKLERNLLPPPHSKDKLTQYALALGIKKGSSQWYEFFDLAAAHRGKIPDEIMKDEELVGKLPVLFRTLRGEKVSDEKLNELIERIRKS